MAGQDKASPGDEVAGSKLDGPEEARFERAQPVLIPREPLRGSREAPLRPQRNLRTAFPLHVLHGNNPLLIIREN